MKPQITDGELKTSDVVLRASKELRHEAADHQSLQLFGGIDAGASKELRHEAADHMLA